MKTFSLRFSICLFALLTHSAWATSLQYSFDDVAFDDGGIATGTFVYDTELEEVTDWNITTSGGNESNFPPFTYSPETSTASRFDAGDLQPRITFRDSEAESQARALRMTPTLPLTDGGEIPLQLETAGGSVECFNCFPSRSIISGALTDSSVLATSLQYSFDDVAFDDGGIATGTFVYDTELEEVTDWNITTSGGNESNFPPFTYSPETSTASRFDAGDLQPRITFRDSEAESQARALRMTPTLPLTDGGEIPLQLETAGGSVECFNCFPSRSIISGALTDSSVLATSLQYSFDDVAFDDGGIATGTFVYDTELEEVTDWNITTSGGNESNFPPFTYSPETSTVFTFDFGDLQPRITFEDNDAQPRERQLRITPTLPLTDGGEIPLQLETSDSAECFNCAPFRPMTSGSLTSADAAPGFVINAGLNGAWKNPATTGQGIFLDVFPQIGQVFLGWFTYEAELPDAEDAAIVGYSGHRWLTAQGDYSGDTAALEVFLSTDGLFDNPRETMIDPYGTITVTFSSCTQGTLEYNFPDPGLSGTMPLVRPFADPLNIVLCDTLSDVD